MPLSLLGGDVGWFPDDYVRAYYICKGLLSFTATVLVIVHMSTTWHKVTEWGQRLRYLALFAAISVITFASAEQLSEGVGVSYRNLGGGGVAVLTIWAMVVSIRHDLKGKP